MILTIVAVLVIAMLAAAFVTDYRDRKNGIKTASPRQIAENVRIRKRETRMQMKMMRRGFNAQQTPGQGRRSPGAPYLRPDEGPPRRGR
jgi:Flp pilus assembly protein TadB